MSRLAIALELAARGFHVFPCQPNQKVPAITDFPNRASRQEEQIKRWFADGTRNIGISTSRFGDDKALLVVDVDTKGKFNGEHQILTLELEGFGFPATFEQSTPSGGRHLIYCSDFAVRQGVNKLGAGVDVRSRGGYIVGPGSEIDGRAYRANALPLATAPTWLVERLGVDSGADASRPVCLDGVSGHRASHRALVYLAQAPVAIEGQGGDAATFKVAAALKDLGCDEATAFDLMAAHWNEKCEPPWSLSDLRTKVHNAYRYGREPAGSRAPEAVFDKVKDEDGEGDDPGHPVERLNKEYAYIKAGAFILQETTDQHGRFDTLRLSPSDMHSWFANKPITIGKKTAPISKFWMENPKRREYDRVVFSPQNHIPSRFYNLWRGFSVQPADTPDHFSVKMFCEHLHENVCQRNDDSARWLTGFFAHLIQRPGQKPLTALVFKGDKGVGKNALVERVGALLGHHFLVADDERYLLSNFNSHLESNLFFVLDEASWAGDKRAEGKLKGLITGTEHVIERKGAEPYRVDNLTRVAILGNDSWLVPATVDERRFAVFDVGPGRKQDRRFFETMRVGMQAGGYASLLRYLMDVDLTGFDVNAAPTTPGLVAQKHQSLPILAQWWLDCLETNSLAGAEWDEDQGLPPLISKTGLVAAFQRWARERNVRSRLPGRNNINQDLVRFGLQDNDQRAGPDDRARAWTNPGIAQLRAAWERYIGGPHEWRKK